MHNLTLTQHSQALKDGTYSSVELTQWYLKRIESLNPSINCYITVNAKQALQQAAQADTLRKSNPTVHPLCGIPISYKDLICTKDTRTSCGSKMLADFVSPYDATLVTRLNQAGVINLGKTNLDEFAMGSSNEHSYFGSVKNPWNLKHCPGGSSGGSAASIAADCAAGSIGTDTGGSIRQPAAFCGVTGLKPTYGKISRYGVTAFASSLDQAGPIARTAQDVAMILQTIAGFDAQDATSSQIKVDDYLSTLDNSIKGLKIGIIKEYFAMGLSHEVHEAVNKAISTLEELGVTFVELSFQYCDAAIGAYYVISSAECASNLARYDGMRYGHRSKKPTDLNALYSHSRSEGFGQEVKRRIMTGNYVLCSGYYDAYYQQAQKVRRLIADEFRQAFQQVDLILAPTTPTTAFELGQKTKQPVEMYQADIFTTAVNLAGLPAISIPAGFAQQLPIGVQLIANAHQEATLLNVAHQFQQTTHWHQAIAPIAEVTL